MATQLLPFLLLLLGSAAGIDLDTHLQWVCDGRDSPGDVVRPSHCPIRPCNTDDNVGSALTLSLPLLLSLDTYASDWGPELLIFNTAGEGCGLVMGKNTADEILLWGATCGGPWHNVSVHHSSASSGGRWIHVEVRTGTQQVGLYLQGHKDVLLTLTCRNHPPSQMLVFPYSSTYGYSALSYTTDYTTTTTTTHPLLLPLSIALSILVVVVVVVLVWCIAKKRSNRGHTHHHTTTVNPTQPCRYGPPYYPAHHPYVPV